MSDAFFSEMKNTEEKKFKQFYQWSASDNFAAELERCLSKKCHADTTPHTHEPREFTLPSIYIYIYIYIPRDICKLEGKSRLFSYIIYIRR